MCIYFEPIHLGITNYIHQTTDNVDKLYVKYTWNTIKNIMFLAKSAREARRKIQKDGGEMTEVHGTGKMFFLSETFLPFKNISFMFLGQIIVDERKKCF